MMRRLIQLCAICAAIVVGFVIWTWFTPLMMAEAGVCGESPAGYYQGQIVLYEVTDYGGAALQVGRIVGDTADFLNFYILGGTLC